MEVVFENIYEQHHQIAETNMSPKSFYSKATYSKSDGGYLYGYPSGQGDHR